MDIKKIEGQMDMQALLTMELIKASEKYYSGQTPDMSDIEFDKKVEQLKALEEAAGFRYEGSPTYKVGASSVTELKKVTHEFPALSLDKVKYKDREDLVKWLSVADDDIDFGSAVLSWKCDGSTVVLTYDNGKLTQAVTRGDGTEGNDITHNAVFFKGVPKEIEYKGHLVVRGEALMTTAEFERVNALSGGIYENPRNLASATIQMLDSSESKEREICFKAFELVYPEPERDMALLLEDDISLSSRFMDDRFRYLEILGFDVVDYDFVDSTDVLEKIEKWKEKLGSLNYPTDGLVLSYNDVYEGWQMGSTGHHPRWAMALKWTDETVTTTIRDIEWSVGKTGVITPVAIFDEVRLGLGSNVTRASLHNLSIMKNLSDHTGEGCQSTLIIGAKAEVYLANMIIPQVASVTVDEDTRAAITPQKCPVCGSLTRIESTNGVATLHCDNTSCPARQVGNLMNSFSKDGLFIKGLGESQIIDLMEVGLVNAEPLSFYEIADEDRANSVYPKESDFASKVNALWDKDGWGKKKWNNLISAIEASRDTTLQKFLYSLNIPLLGNDLSKKLSKFFDGDIKDFMTFVDQAVVFGTKQAYDQLVEIDGIADEKAGNICDWLLTLADDKKAYEDFKAFVGMLNFPKKTAVSSDNSLEGLTFVITGAVRDYKNRDEFKASVEARGGKVAGSVSAKTSFLVNNDIESTSGKNAKAKQLGIEIISEDEFIQRFGK